MNTLSLQALNAMRAAGASRALLYYLSERHAHVRALTADALSHLRVGDGNVALSLVDSMMDDDDARVRTAAGRALGRIYANRSQSSSQGDLQQVVARWQGEMDWSKIIALTAKGLGSKKEQVRRACVGGLGAMGSAGNGCGQVVESVVNYLTNSNHSVRLSAASALLEIGNVGGFVQAAIVRFLNARIEAPNGRRLLTGQGSGSNGGLLAEVESVRLACYVLGHVGDIRDEESLLVLRKLLPRPDLTRSHGEALLAPHSTRLSSDVQLPKTRRPSWMTNCSFEALVRISHIDWRDRGDTASIVAVRRLNQDKQDTIRMSVCEALGELASPGDRTSLELLTDLNYDPSEGVVQAAMCAVAKLVAGSSDSHGMSVKLSSIVRPEAKSRRLVSAARQMPETPKRLIITREMMDKEADVRPLDSNACAYSRYQLKLHVSSYYICSLLFDCWALTLASSCFLSLICCITSSPPPLVSLTHYLSLSLSPSLFLFSAIRSTVTVGTLMSTGVTVSEQLERLHWATQLGLKQPCLRLEYLASYTREKHLSRT